MTRWRAIILLTLSEVVTWLRVRFDPARDCTVAAQPASSPIGRLSRSVVDLCDLRRARRPRANRSIRPHNKLADLGGRWQEFFGTPGRRQPHPIRSRVSGPFGTKDGERRAYLSETAIVLRGARSVRLFLREGQSHEAFR